MHIVEELLCLAIEVVIEDVGLARGHCRCRDHLYLRVGLLYRIEELGEAAIVTHRLVKPVLIAHLDILERKRLRMAVARANRAPFRTGATAHIFNLVQCVLHVWFESWAGINMLLLHRVACIDCKQRLHLQVLTPL